MTKPKKALKNLFSRTEPQADEQTDVAVENTAAIAVDTLVAAPALPVEALVEPEAHLPPSETPVAPVVAASALLVETPVAPVADAPALPAETVAEAHVSVAQDAPETSLAESTPAGSSELLEVSPGHSDVAAEAAEASLEAPFVVVASSIISEEMSLAPSDIENVSVSTLEPEAAGAIAPSEAAAVVSAPAPAPIPESAVTPVEEAARLSVVEEHQAHHANVAAAVLRVQYNFEVRKDEREAWGEREYVDFIRRIDVAQAEAFFLKGKLLAEVKDRFFLENKVGWKDFAEGILGMNYTTANQYIRVSVEFDVTSHRRPDFGFEHYKALLPLKTEERTKLLSELPQVSVKELRSIVQRKLLEGSNPAPRAQKSTAGREMIDLLVSLKEKIGQCSRAEFSQTERWQLTAACRNLAEDLEALASDLDQSPRRATRGAGASAYVESLTLGD